MASRPRAYAIRKSRPRRPKDEPCADVLVSVDPAPELNVIARRATALILGFLAVLAIFTLLTVSMGPFGSAAAAIIAVGFGVAAALSWPRP